MTRARDGTGEVAHAAAAHAGAADRLTVLAGRPLPAGWTGKLWAMQQGVEHAEASRRAICYSPMPISPMRRDALRRLVAHAESRGLVLASLMAKLRCESLAERGLIPAFIFFFEMLYPFAWVNRPERATAGAAGGCMLVRRDALRAAGGIDAIRARADRRLRAGAQAQGARSDLARAHRPGAGACGPIRSSATSGGWSRARPIASCNIRRCSSPAPSPAWASPISPRRCSHCSRPAGRRRSAPSSWLTMALAFQPILQFYRVSPWWGVALPGIALAYLAFTLDSAYQHARGRGGLWKGRVQAKPTGT